MKGVFNKLGGSLRRGPSADGGAAPTSSDGSGLQRRSSGVTAVEAQVAKLRIALEEKKKREARLASLKPLIVDATLVECLSSGFESVDDKLHAFEALRASGLTNILLAAFVRGVTPDAQFLQALRARGLIDEHCWAASELFDANGSDLPGQDLPFGLAKMIQFGIQNAVLECDLAAPYINWNKYTIGDFCALLESRCRCVPGVGGMVT
ncbi:hypothetical protein GPECTOR_62g936 [Gonium pectorale]|uniref:Uncharacterized protein n=1 Tax=Gonium pectorale TaxID=33097 RepID=A0A150G4S6_GONPE|nr:hypothetical protein GPECTOR_62g936 [Gonium pectorale]|eukprot:KXZ44821.1 hypothetical protein GPECTOR_62g936 [Gonium pectorale]